MAALWCQESLHQSYAVDLLIGAIIGSLVNIEYAMTDIFPSIVFFNIGMIIGSLQRMEQILSSLTENRTGKSTKNRTVLPPITTGTGEACPAERPVSASKPSWSGWVMLTNSENPNFDITSIKVGIFSVCSPCNVNVSERNEAGSKTEIGTNQDECCSFPTRSPV